ncbi:MAG: SCO family protein [Bacteroidetes bacterium]|nr:SCO family protein [Bacteroidota bacterium]MDA1120229.1 SCO family protein [Bacteroidota bacterium]
MNEKAKVIVLLFFGALQSCEPTDKKLPVLGRPQLIEKIVDGATVIDTIAHSIAEFKFLNQDSVWVTNSTFNDKIYVADFFFTSCPSICPIMKSQLIRIYDKFENEERLKLVSYSIDPEYDTVAVLRDYANALGVSSDRWHFLTGDKNEIYDLGEISYMVAAAEDEESPGGFLHSGAFLLIDGQRRIRGVYDGTVSDQIDELMADIRILLKENEKAE